ncbi:MAG: hypothetical protein IPN40_04570 [Uliginosibacterium sp.]|nr:hypothetical protein [Uliginosibacterium sp.]
MRTLFLTHEQRLLYYQEPGYTEIILPMLKSGMLKEHCIYNYQREWRWLYSNYEKSSADKLEIRRKSVETQYKLLEKKFEEFKPELVVYIATWPSEAIRSTVFLELKNNFSFKLCSVISDHQETDTDSQTHDRCTINASDLTLILDSFSRTERIKSRAGIYSDFTNTDRVIFLPTIPLWDYFKPSKIKKYDVTLSGSLEGFRQNVPKNCSAVE